MGGGLYNHESSVMSGLQRSCVAAFVALVRVCHLSEALIFMWGSLFESYIGLPPVCGDLGSQSQWSAVELDSPGQMQGSGSCTSLVFGLLHP